MLLPRTSLSLERGSERRVPGIREKNILKSSQRHVFCLPQLFQSPSLRSALSLEVSLFIFYLLALLRDLSCHVVFVCVCVCVCGVFVCMCVCVCVCVCLSFPSNSLFLSYQWPFCKQRINRLRKKLGKEHPSQ